MEKLVVAIIAAAVILSACVSASIKPSPGEIAGIQNIAVVAIEPPPLRASSFTYSGPGRLTGLGGGGPGAEYLVVLFGIIMLLEHVTSDAESSEPAIPLHDALNRSEAWLPTVELARETAAQMRAGLGVNVDVVDGYLALPGIENRDLTYWGENWQAPLRAWFNEDESSFDHVRYTNKNIDAVVEVGILNYEMFGGGLLIQVASKLVNPTNKRVLGRSRNGVLAEAPPNDILFGNEGRNYKEFFAKTTRDLIAANLKELGLLP